MKRLVFILGLVVNGTAYSLEWSSNQIEYLYGDRFHEPFNSEPVSKSTLSFQHASGFSRGRNFAFLDLLQSGSSDQKAFEYYGEGYNSLSLGKQGWFKSNALVQDINITTGLNFGQKHYPTHNINPRVVLFGPTIDLSLPGFNFLNLDVLVYVDRGLFAGGNNGCHATTWQISPAWNIDFSLGGEKFVLDGFIDLIGAHGACARQLVTQPRIGWEIGDHFGQSGRWYLGVEYQYWQNKFGISGEYERAPQIFFMWKL